MVCNDRIEVVIIRIKVDFVKCCVYVCYEVWWCELIVLVIFVGLVLIGVF